MFINKHITGKRVIDEMADKIENLVDKYNIGNKPKKMLVDLSDKLNRFSCLIQNYNNGILFNKSEIYHVYCDIDKLINKAISFELPYIVKEAIIKHRVRIKKFEKDVIQLDECKC